MSTVSDTIFEMISDPTGINLSVGQNPRLFEKVYFKDSLLKFYPFGEVFLNDKQGIIVSAYTFIEGMKFATKLGSPEIDIVGAESPNTTTGGYLVHDYAWSESQIAGTVRDSDYLSGTNQFILISDYFFKDSTTGSAYKEQPSEIAKTIANNVFGITDTSKIFIDTTNNDPSNIWYQGNKTNRHFIEDTLCRNAYSSKVLGGDKVPFVSFINCAGEFYFCSYATLYSQTPVASFDARLSLNKVQDPFAVQEITFLCGGAPLNKKVYQQDFFCLDQDGTIADDTISLSDKVLKVSKLDKYPVNNANIGKTQSIYDLGLFETGDEYLRVARENFTYQNSCIAFRIEIVIYFNPKVITGKVVDINIKKFTENDQYATELSGHWLVIESEHQMDKDNMIFSRITLARPAIPFASEWNYSANIIS